MLAVAVFVADTVTEHEIAVAVLYVAVVLIAVRVLRRREILLVGGVCVTLTLASYALTRGDPTTVTGIVNCLISVAAILATTYLCLKNQAADRALEHARTELAHMQRLTALGELTASIVHEVNQPVAGTVTNADAALQWLAADPPNIDEARQAIEAIVEDGKRTSETVSRVRALVRKAPPRWERLNLNEVIRQVIALTQTDLQRHRVVVLSNLAANLPPVRGDRVQLQQLVLNLILNGIEAMTAIEARPRQLVISTAVDGGNVVGSVRDAGAGFDSDQAGRLFEAFYTTKPQGTGMGLAICRSIVEAHGGRITGSPNPNGGATFRFSLPHG